MILYENKGSTFYAEKRQVFSCSPHLHHHIELVYLSEGSTDITVNDQTITASAGDAIVVFPNQIHAFRDHGALRGYIVIAPPDDFPEFGSLFQQNLPTTPLLPQVGHEIHRLFYHICRHAADKPTYGNPVQRGYTLALLGLLAPRLSLRRQGAQNLSVVQEVLLYCDTHYTENLTLETLARTFGISRFYVSHIFSDKVKISFTGYLHRLRIEAAKQLLAQGTQSVTEVADRVGYSNIRSFNRQFSRIAGSTPSQYRQQQSSQKNEVVG